MHTRILKLVAYVLGIVATSFALPLATAFWYGEYDAASAFALPMAFGWTLALLVRPWRSSARAADARTAFASVGSVWLAMGLFGALPLYLSGRFGGFTDAVFESVSGFTTTGASILADVESLPRCINLWRCQTHWLGGMGVIALAIALVPVFGVGGFRMIKAETTGPEKGKLTARIAGTAKILWFLYLGFTILETLLLSLAGMGTFDALCHTFSTIGTGGFSTRNASIGSFGLPSAEWICSAFMLLASVNFALYYHVLRGRFGKVVHDSELRAFLGIALCAILLVAASNPLDSLEKTFRIAAFQTLSILSTTGFMTADYVLWRPSAHIVLLALFLIGGCSGSTGGGIKVIRWTVLAKQLGNEIRRLLHPHGVFTIRINGVPGRDEVVPTVAAFVFAYVLLVLATALAGAFAGLDLETAFTAGLSMAGNVGPAFGRLGPTSNYALVPDALKWVYCLAMLAGRLEIYTLLILLGGPFSRRR